jgi:periplasmic protein CpxP/Spy
LKPAAPPTLLAALLLLGASASFAQPPPPGVHSSEWRRMRAQHEQEMMTDLHTVLRIRPEQEEAFQAFAASMHPPDGGPPEMEDLEHLTTPELIDRLNARHAAHDADERRRGQAVKRFYAALSPEQRQVFDALHRLTMGHGGWGMHGRRGPPPPP